MHLNKQHNLRSAILAVLILCVGFIAGCGGGGGETPAANANIASATEPSQPTFDFADEAEFEHQLALDGLYAVESNPGDEVMTLNLFGKAFWGYNPLNQTASASTALDVRYTGSKATYAADPATGDRFWVGMDGVWVWRDGSIQLLYPTDIWEIHALTVGPSELFVFYRTYLVQDNAYRVITLDRNTGAELNSDVVIDVELLRDVKYDANLDCFWLLDWEGNVHRFGRDGQAQSLPIDLPGVDIPGTALEFCEDYLAVSHGKSILFYSKSTYEVVHQETHNLSVSQLALSDGYLVTAEWVDNNLYLRWYKRL